MRHAPPKARVFVLLVSQEPHVRPVHLVSLVHHVKPVQRIVRILPLVMTGYQDLEGAGPVLSQTRRRVVIVSTAYVGQMGSVRAMTVGLLEPMADSVQLVHKGSS